MLRACPKVPNHPPHRPKRLDVLREELRVHRYAPRTGKTYEAWVRRFIRFQNLRHPRTVGVDEIHQFLTHLTVVDQVSASTQNQALSALLILSRLVLKIDIEELESLV